MNDTLKPPRLTRVIKAGNAATPKKKQAAPAKSAASNEEKLQKIRDRIEQAVGETLYEQLPNLKEQLVDEIVKKLQSKTKT